MFQEIPKLDKKGLRKFGLLLGTTNGLLVGCILPSLLGHGLFVIPWIVASGLYSLAIFNPNALNPIYRRWMRVAQVLAWINSRLILGIIFLIVVIPMALIMKLIKRDPMTRKFQFNLKSYRVSSQTKSKISMEKPY